MLGESTPRTLNRLDRFREYSIKNTGYCPEIVG